MSTSIGFYNGNPFADGKSASNVDWGSQQCLFELFSSSTYFDVFEIGYGQWKELTIDLITLWELKVKNQIHQIEEQIRDLENSRTILLQNFTEEKEDYLVELSENIEDFKSEIAFGYKLLGVFDVFEMCIYSNHPIVAFYD